MLVTRVAVVGPAITPKSKWNLGLTVEGVRPNCKGDRRVVVAIIARRHCGYCGSTGAEVDREAGPEQGRQRLRAGLWLPDLLADPPRIVFVIDA